MDREIQSKLITHLGNFVSEHKKELIKQVLKNRTRQVTIVLEDIYHPQNASAALRTCDCFGVQDIHIIENRHNYEVNPRVVLGASKWVNTIHYNSDPANNTVSAINTLKNRGYKIIGTAPSNDYIPVNRLDVNEKIAVVFGTELEGLSKEAMDLCDQTVCIPMFGFTESFNLSVSVAIILNILIGKLHASSQDWRLSIEEKEALKLAWYKKIVDRSEILEKAFLKEFEAKR